MSGLCVGAAKVSIFPTADCYPIGSFQAGREGEELYARAIVIENSGRKILFESLELAGVPDADRLADEVGRAAGIPAEDVILTATHDHSAPFVVGDAMQQFTPTEADWKFREIVFSGAIQAACQAVHTMRPARMGYGEGKSFINVNRDEHFRDGYWMQGTNWEGCSDKTVSAVKFVDEEGRLIAAIVNYAMHANCTFLTKDTDGQVKVTCDIPGIASLFLEGHYGGGAVVLWQSGAAGNQNPVYIGIKKVFDQQTGTMYAQFRQPGAAYEEAQVLGQQHGMDIMDVLDSIQAEQTEAAITSSETILSFPGQKYPEGFIDPGFHRLMVDNLLVCMGGIPFDQLPPKKLAEMEPVDQPVPARAKMVCLGNTVFFLLSAELYNEIGVLCKEVAGQLYPDRHLVVVTHLGGTFAGYILDDGSKGHKVFQSFGKVREGQSNGIVLNGMQELFNQLQ